MSGAIHLLPHALIAQTGTTLHGPFLAQTGITLHDRILVVSVTHYVADSWIDV
jgi:hypothetical protein